MPNPQFTAEETFEQEDQETRRKAFVARQKRRLEAVAGARQLAEIAGEAPGLQEEALQSGRTAARSQAAAALAGGLASGVPLGSGAGLAAARQSAKDTGITLSQIESQGQANILGARQEAARQLVESNLFEEELGDLASDRQARSNELEAQIQAIFAANKGRFDDDEFGASEAIKRLANDETDPVLRQRLLDRAEEVRSKREDF